MMHPTEQDLALFAGGDLGYFGRRRVEHHLGTCARCRAEVAEFGSLRTRLRNSEALPDVHWDRLAAEMKANIHVGLEAGACIADRFPFLSPARAWLAYAGTLALLAVAVWVGQSGPVVTPAVQDDRAVLAAVGGGIELQHGGAALALLHSRARDARDVTVSASAQGAMRARYVDAETGQVTINNVYVQ